jgi:hypothetical protein
MTVLAEAMAAQAGLVKDPSGNLVYPEQIAAAAPEPVAPAAAPASAPRAAVAPAQAVKPVKPASPEVDIPEPPVIGQPVDAADAAAATKKKSLLGA